MIICIEGGDACGKATQAKILADRLQARLFSFPAYETLTGDAIRGNLAGGYEGWQAMSYRDHAGRTFEAADAASIMGWRESKRMNALVLQSLMLVNRMELGAELRGAARQGPVVIDRYDASSLVYGKVDGIDPAWIQRVNEQLPVRPDLYILLDVPVEESFRRRPERRDRYEKDRPFMAKIRAEYLELFKTRGAQNAGWITIDATGELEDVSSRIWTAVGL